MKTRIHVTDLEAWRWFNQIEDMPKEELIGRLLRTAPANEQMEMGTAFHAILEDPPDEITEIERNGFRFKVECDAEINLPQVREIRACKTYLIDGVEVTLTGKLDGVTGNEVDDHKLSFNPNPENYFPSYQWRAYLDIFNADVFKYLIYHGDAKGKDVSIRDVSALKMYRYPEMITDLERGIRELLGFIKAHIPQMIRN